VARKKILSTNLDHRQKLIKKVNAYMNGNDKNFKITKNVISNTHSEKHLLTLNRNVSFCQSFIKKINIATTVSDEDIVYKSNLVYNLPKNSGFDYEAIQAIIDLLLQLRAAQSDQNVFVQNNTVVRQQILRQLKNELMKVQGGLTQNQIQKLGVVSSNTFDEETLNELLNSLLEDSKKKLGEKKGKKQGRLSAIKNTNTEILHNLNEKYTKLINSTRQNEHVVNEVLNKIHKKENVNKYIDSKSPDLEYVKAQAPEERAIFKEIQNKEIVENQRGISNLLQEENVSYQKRILNKYNFVPKIQKTHTDLIISDLKEKYKSVVANIFEETYSKYKLFDKPEFEYDVQDNIIKRISEFSVKDQQILKSEKRNAVSHENVETFNKKQILNISRLVSQVDKISSRISTLNLSQEFKDTVLDIWQNAYSKYVTSFEEFKNVNHNVLRENEYENVSKSNIVHSNVITSYDKVKEQVYKEIEDFYIQNSIASKESQTLKKILVNVLEKKELSDLYSEIINKKIAHTRTNVINGQETKITNTKQDNLLINKRELLRQSIDVAEITNKDSFIYKIIESSVKKILQNNVKENIVNILEKKEFSDLYNEIINKNIAHTRTNVINDLETKITNTKQDNLLINKRKFLRKNIDIAEITNKDSFIYKTIESSIKKILQSNVKENVSEIFKDENYQKVFTDIIKNVRKTQISRLNEIEKEKKIKEEKKTRYTSDTTIKEKKRIDKAEENVYDRNIFKISEAVKNIRKSEKLNLKESITNLRKNILINKINKELTVNLLDKQEYKNLTYDRYAVIDKHYLQTQKINERQTELGIKSIYEDKTIEKTSQKQKTVKFDEGVKKPSKLDKQIDLVSKIINKSLISEILSNKEYINIDNIKSDVVKNYKIQINKIKKKTLETNLEHLYQEQLNKVEKINRKVTQTDKIISRISKLKNTVDTIYKVSAKSKILEFFTKNHSIKVQDIKNLISNRRYFDTTREYEKNIRSDVRDVFQEEISRTNRVYRTSADYSINQKVTKENLKQVNRAVDKSKNIQTTVKNLTRENLNIDSKINSKLNKYNFLLSNISEEDVINKNYDSIDLINRNVQKRRETSQKILDINKTAQLAITKEITENIQKNILNSSKILNKNIIDKNIITSISSINEEESSSFINNLYLNILNKREKSHKKTKNILEVINKNLTNNTITDDLQIYSETQKVYKDNIINTQVQNENRVLKKDVSVIDKKIINERVKLATENVVNKVFSTDMITHKNIKTSKDILNIENINEVYKDVPLTIKENINQIYSVENFIPRKKLKHLSPKVVVDKTATHEQKDFFRDIVQSSRSYYNDAIEEMGKEHIIRERKILQDEKFHRNVIKNDMVYKTPINLDKSKEKSSKWGKEQKQDTFHSDIVKKKISREEFEAQNGIYRVEPQKSQKKEKTLNKNDIINIVQSYIGDINVDNISKVVMRKVEDKMSFDRKRRGVL
jgi:hypothetical protein